MYKSKHSNDMNDFAKVKNLKAIMYQRSNTLKITKKQKTIIEQTDIQFAKSIEKICKNKKKNVLKQIVDLKKATLSQKQCQQIHFRAKRHCEANIINKNSSKNNQYDKNNNLQNDRYCLCGCQKMRGQKYPLCHDIQSINLLGSGILLFFMFLKYLIAVMLVIFLVYAIYGMAINMQGQLYKTKNPSGCLQSHCFFKDQSSSYNRISGDKYLYILQYLGLGSMFVVGLIFRFLIFNARQKDKIIDSKMKTASDYAIKINNLPYGEYNQQELLEYLQDRMQKILLHQKGNEKQQQIQHDSQNQISLQNGANINDKSTQEFKQDRIKYVQIIYNIQFCRKMLQKLDKMCIQLFEMLNKQKNTYIVTAKVQDYKQLKDQIIETYELLEDLRRKFLNDSQFRKKISTTTTIIYFRDQESKLLIQRMMGKQKVGIFKKLRQRIIRFICRQNTQIYFKGSIPEIERAPQPSDIIWNNCQKKQSLSRILGIYFISLLLILVSFGIILFLQYIQNNYSESSISSIINILTAISLQIVNKIIWISLTILLNLEYNHTFTNKIISLMDKTTFLSWFNVIILPIMVNYVYKSKLYGINGLSGSVYDYHFSSLIITLTLKLFDPITFILKFLLWIRFTRFLFIKAKYNKIKQDVQVPQQSQMKSIYKLYQGPEFNIAQAYVFIMTNMFHAVFFCQLQPFILVLALLQSIYFYWICKFHMLKICMIPGVTQKRIFESAVYKAILLPVFFGVGSIFISFIQHKEDETKRFEYIGGIICIIFGSINYFNPQNIVQRIIDSIMSLKQEQKQQGLQEQRVEDYFKNSNSLALLGFQKMMTGQVNLEDIQKQLQTYCCSHIHRSQEYIIQVNNVLNNQIVRLIQGHNQESIIK